MYQARTSTKVIVGGRRTGPIVLDDQGVTSHGVVVLEGRAADLINHMSLIELSHLGETTPTTT